MTYSNAWIPAIALLAAAFGASAGETRYLSNEGDDVSGNVFEEMPHGLFHRNGFGPNETPCAGAPKGYRIHDNKVMP